MMVAPLDLMRAYAMFSKKKGAVLRSLPKPRMKKWWETLQDHELDHFYKQMEIEKAPKRYRELQRLILKHNLIKHIITI